MTCISSVSFSIMINGHSKGNFSPSRGLRQGDPLSPYLFLLCSEGFTSLINSAENSNLLSGIIISKKAHPISHLLFADDSILFFNATTNNCHIILNILRDYELASGQSINLNKSAVLLSPNITSTSQDTIQSTLGIKIVSNLGKYLGLPSKFSPNQTKD